MDRNGWNQPAPGAPEQTGRQDSPFDEPDAAPELRQERSENLYTRDEPFWHRVVEMPRPGEKVRRDPNYWNHPEEMRRDRFRTVPPKNLAERVRRFLGRSVVKKTILVIAVLLVIAVVYTAALVFSFKGISYVAQLCVWLYVTMLGLFLVGSDIIYTLETSVTAMGNMVTNFFRMATWLDPLRATADGGALGFPQQWTVFYWAYWIAWCVATPFFIGRISEGRTLKQVILGGLTAGVGATILSFSVFGNFGLHLQATGRIAVAEKLAAGANASEVIIEIFEQLPLPEVTMVVLVVAMIFFYASTFDALAMVMSTYSYKGDDLREPGKGMKAYWSLIFVVLPIGLLFSEQAMTELQTISIIAALPISVCLLLVLISFFKSSKRNEV